MGAVCTDALLVVKMEVLNLVVKVRAEVKVQVQVEVEVEVRRWGRRRRRRRGGGCSKVVHLCPVGHAEEPILGNTTTRQLAMW